MPTHCEKYWRPFDGCDCAKCAAARAKLKQEARIARVVLSQGRCHLVVAGYYVAMEGDLCRDADFPSRYWVTADLERVAAAVNAAVVKPVVLVGDTHIATQQASEADEETQTRAASTTDAF